MSKRVLLIDDERTSKSANVRHPVTAIARTFSEGMNQLKHNGPWDLLLLDHDLASFEDGVEKTGYDIIKWLEDMAFSDCIGFVPKKIECVSDNPVGRKNIEQAIKSIERIKRRSQSDTL